MIGGIVLAGGRSKRMGRPKALLEAGGSTFLERAVRVLAAGGCEEVVVVVNSDDPTLADLAEQLGARITHGAGAGSEQIDSLRAGLQALPPELEAVVVLPVDHPLVEPSTVRQIVEAFRAGAAPIVRPVYEGRHGHPALFGAVVFDDLLHGALPDGARTLVRAHAGSTGEVEVDDRGVLIDVDTPEDYEEHVRKGRETGGA
jgi:CTP:molybdopterin cytidylyltransferase MocA